MIIAAQTMVQMLCFYATPGEYREDHVLLVLSPSNNLSPKHQWWLGYKAGE
jgi:hypothetical protein